MSMCRRTLPASMVIVLCLCAGSAFAGVAYPDPAGGWTYIFNGDVATAGPTDNFDSLDGTWDHDNGSDQWDGSIIGEGRPGGVNALVEDSVDFIRIQETGDPRNHDMDDPGSNRKIFLGHLITTDIGAAIADTVLDDGLTISFRARISTGDPLDDLHPDNNTDPIVPWPEGGDGYVTHNGGKGGFTVCQPVGDDKGIAFCLALTSDDDELPANGLVMNKLNGNSPTGDVDLQDDDDGELNILEIEDPTAWHEFWITIQADTSGTGTHLVTIYVDGELGANEFLLTAGTGDDYGDSYIAMAQGATPQSGAMDVDFFAYKEGVHLPPGALLAAHSPNPATGATDVADTISLTWEPGDLAVSHDVYFGEDFNDVNGGAASAFAGNQPGTTFAPPGGLELGRKYYWKVNEVNADANVVAGRVWTFTVADHILVEGFETYTDFDPNRVFDTWKDGWNVAANGSQIGRPEDPTTAPFTDQVIFHGGENSMPFNFDNSGSATLSWATAAVADLKSGSDWTRQGVKALSLWVMGNAPAFGSFVQAGDTITMTAGGSDIWDDSDQFHFAYQEVTGRAEVIAKVQSVSATHPWTKAGVMVRNTLDPDSKFAAVFVTPDNGVALQLRSMTGADAQTADQVAAIVAPQWVKIVLEVSGRIRAYYSADGQTWIELAPAGAPIVEVQSPVYAGLALTSHDVDLQATAEFSNVSFETSNTTTGWNHQDIGIISNDPELLYVVVSDGANEGVSVNPDSNAAITTTWQPWDIPLKEFEDQNVDLTNVVSVTLGAGDKLEPKTGGSGAVYFDDLRLYPPRCVLNKITPIEGDITGDCLVDFADVEAMSQDWLLGDSTRTGQLLVHYKLDEGAGLVAADSSGNGRDGAITGATWAGGKVGSSALSFDGGSAEVNEPNAAAYLNGLDQLTVTVWVKSNETGSDSGFIIFADPAGNDQRDIRYDSAGSVGGGTNVIKYGVTTTTGNQEIESSSNVQTTDWQHIAMTWKTDEAIKLYIDGTLDTPSSTDDIESGVTTGCTKLLIGRGGKDETDDATGEWPSWNGLVDDVRIYDFALTEAEIATVMGGGAVQPRDIYSPLESPANIYDLEDVNEKKVNFKDFAVLADQWLLERFWPEP